MKNPWSRPDEFTPKEVQLGAGITRGVYDQGVFRGIISAEQPADGPGRRSVYTFKDIVRTTLTYELKKYDVRVKKAAMLADQILEKIEQMGEWGTIYLAWGADGIQFYSEDAVKNKNSFLVLNIDMILSNACGRIDEEKPE